MEENSPSPSYIHDYVPHLLIGFLSSFSLIQYEKLAESSFKKKNYDIKKYLYHISTNYERF